MNPSGGGPGALRALALISEQLEAYLEGDELAFETLGERFEEAGLGADHLHEALCALRSVTGETGFEDFAGAAAPARDSHRVLSSEERAAISPEAWGFLLGLRRRGSLDAGQFEQVLATLIGVSLRPVDVETARDVAVRVALRVEDGTDPWMPPADHERTH